MTTLGIDFGEKWIGLALGKGKFAAPLTTLRVKEIHQTLKEIVHLCQEFKVEKIVLGLPCDREGKVGSRGEKIKRFRKVLEEVSGIGVVYQDEDLSSTEAVRKMIKAGVPKMKRRKRENEFAAALILQRFLDTHPSSTL